MRTRSWFPICGETIQENAVNKHWEFWKKPPFRSGRWGQAGKGPGHSHIQSGKWTSLRLYFGSNYIHSLPLSPEWIPTWKPHLDILSYLKFNVFKAELLTFLPKLAPLRLLHFSWATSSFQSLKLKNLEPFLMPLFHMPHLISGMPQPCWICRFELLVTIPPDPTGPSSIISFCLDYSNSLLTIWQPWSASHFTSQEHDSSTLAPSNTE